MKTQELKAGKTYVMPNGLQRRLESLEQHGEEKIAVYIPIDRKGRAGEVRRVSEKSFASGALCEAI